MYIDVQQNTASGAEEVALLKKYIAFYFDLHHGQRPGQKCVVFMDMSAASTSNVVSTTYRAVIIAKLRL